MNAPAPQTPRAKFESVLVTCFAVMVGPSLAWAVSALGLG
jgi:hypothetical protein